MFFVFSKKNVAKGPVCECDQLELETSNAILLQPLTTYLQCITLAALYAMHSNIQTHGLKDTLHT